jgi:hypothetical protein
MKLQNRFKSTIKTAKWLVLNNYGRFMLGIILCLTCIFSEYSTIDFLSTDWKLFVWTTNIGVLIITGQFLYWLFRAIYLFITNK